MKLFNRETRVAAVTAHPDDAEILFYGTLRRFRDIGCAVSVIVATDGNLGISVSDRGKGAEITPGQRLRESDRAFRDTGIDVVHLGADDGSIVDNNAFISKLEQRLVEVNPHLILTHHPSSANDHQDHRAVGRSASNIAARLPSCQSLWFGQPIAARSSFSHNVSVEITRWMPEKLEALKSHDSQSGRWYLTKHFTETRAREAGYSIAPLLSAEGKFFEAFQSDMDIYLDQQ